MVLSEQNSTEQHADVIDKLAGFCVLLLCRPFQRHLIQKIAAQLKLNRAPPHI